ncbi:carboxymuconolactone decarboxylase family protein [Streptomyces rishiriensis]|nr:carboxymuconolactone decarboxylase family protein [Streptomyces rishiriensis]
MRNSTCTVQCGTSAPRLRVRSRAPCNMCISQLNACACCLSIHVRDALEADKTQQRIVVLPAWRDTELFTDQERAALTLAESLVSFLTAADKTSTTARLPASSAPSSCPSSAGPRSS